jgi:3-hydroxyisobutyrate dehydrogenase-like beta-hydroxyacid dehydrogenase
VAFLSAAFAPTDAEVPHLGSAASFSVRVDAPPAHRVVVRVDRQATAAPLELMNKDLETFNTIAKELHVPVSFANIAQRYQQAALAAGLGEKDTSVVFTLIERLAGMEPPKQ